MPSEIIWLPGTSTDVTRLRDFIKSKNPLAAQRAAKRIVEGVMMLSESSGAGTPVENLIDYRDLKLTYGSGEYIIRYREEFDGAKAEVANLEQSVRFDSNCRLMGSIEPAGGLTIPQFISKAINDEFKMVGIHSKDGTQLSGSITKVQFSSITSLTNGYWDIGLSFNSSNGESLSIDNKYTFKSGFDAITACNATADALVMA